MSEGTTGLATDHFSAAELNDIQGNIVGFNKDEQSLLFVNFETVEVGRAFLTRMAMEEVNTAHEVQDFNQGYKQRRLRGEDQMSVRSSWVNLALTCAGLKLLAQPADADAFPEDFKQGMRVRAAQIGDVDASDPSTWVGAFAANVQLRCTQWSSWRLTRSVKRAGQRLVPFLTLDASVFGRS